VAPPIGQVQNSGLGKGETGVKCSDKLSINFVSLRKLEQMDNGSASENKNDPIVTPESKRIISFQWSRERFCVKF